MEVDKESKPSFVWIQLDDTPEYLKSMRKTAENELDSSTIKEEGKKLLILNETHTFETDEYYFDEGEKNIHLSGTLKSSNGNSYMSVDIPLSDIVLIDIIQHAIKKLNKLKTAMESLK